MFKRYKKTYFRYKLLSLFLEKRLESSFIYSFGQLIYFYWTKTQIYGENISFSSSLHTCTASVGLHGSLEDIVLQRNQFVAVLYIIYLFPYHHFILKMFF